MGKSNEKKPRPGVATLELVLALPVLLALVVALIWLGFSVIGQAEVTVQARHTAWEARFQPWEGRRYDFNSDGIGDANATQTVRITPVLDQESGPESKHSVGQGNWDHQTLEFDSSLNPQRMAEMMVAAKTVGLVAQAEDIRAALDQFQDVGSGLLTDALREIARELADPRAQLESLAESGKQRVELEKDLAEAKAKGLVRDLESELKNVRSKLDALDDAEAESNEDKSWLLEQQIKRIQIQIQAAKARLRDF